MNDSRRFPSAGKWERATLKSSWYDEHEGSPATPLEAVDNRLRAAAQRFVPTHEERAASSDVERFFDPFDVSQEQ